MAYDEKDAGRVRRVLATRGDVVEKRLMGGLVFMIGGHMCCGVSRGTLMVRVGRTAREALLTQPHVQPMMIGKRSPADFIRVEPPGYASDRALQAWIQRGLDFVAALPAK